MSDLTKQYFDKQLGKLVTKDDLKKELNVLEGNLKLHTEQEVADLAGMMSRRFDELEKKLDVREEVDKLKVQMKKVWEALNIASK
ncbi:MAG: hypothetical protein Q8R55_05325 [Candidatus Taylorbacteria bacterium]|nr:hypothetical protein [Candidatus Taylorbacteria bacterium]